MKALSTGKWPGIDPKEWEAEHRNGPGKGSTLYIRYLGAGGGR